MNSSPRRFWANRLSNVIHIIIKSNRLVIIWLSKIVCFGGIFIKGSEIVLEFVFSLSKSQRVYIPSQFFTLSSMAFFR